MFYSETNLILYASSKPGYRLTISPKNKVTDCPMTRRFLQKKYLN